MTSRKRLLYATIFAIVVLAIPAIADAAMLFLDDFSLGASSAWGNESGNCRYTGGVHALLALGLAGMFWMRACRLAGRNAGNLYRFSERLR